MRERTSVVTRKGQITIPTEFRRALGIEEGDRLTLVVDGDRMEIMRRGSVVARTRGIFRSEGKARTADELREAAEEALAAEAQERSAPS